MNINKYLTPFPGWMRILMVIIGIGIAQVVISSLTDQTGSLVNLVKGRM